MDNQVFKAGDLVAVAGISFPLTLLSINENTNTAALGGASPTAGDVMLPQVCLSEPRQPVPFTVGDVVRLKSGGPVLTVATVEEKGFVSVISWLEENAHPSIIDNLNPAVLKRC